MDLLFFHFNIFCTYQKHPLCCRVIPLIRDAYRTNQILNQTAFESSLRSQIWSICSNTNLATESIDPMTGGRLGHRIDTPPPLHVVWGSHASSTPSLITPINGGEKTSYTTDPTILTTCRTNNKERPQQPYPYTPRPA